VRFLVTSLGQRLVVANARPFLQGVGDVRLRV
jgi:hypothetical protein